MQKQTGRSETIPWSVAQPYFKDIYARGDALSDRPTRYYPDRTVAARSPHEVLASGLAAERAVRGSDVLRAGSETVRATAAGDYLNPASNPYLSDTFRAASDEVTRAYQTAVVPGLASRFAGAGAGGLVRDPASGGMRYASGAASNAERGAQDVLARNLNRLATDIFGGNYQAERSRQLQAGAMAGDVARADYADIEALRATGQGDRSYAQLALDDDVARFQFEQEEPWARVERFRNLIAQPNFTTTTTRGTTDMAGIVGSAVGGAGSLIGLAALCSRELKNVIGDVDVAEILERLEGIPVYRWNYKAFMDDGETHVSPMAEDWQESTGLGDGREIAIVDAFGLLLAGLQGVMERVRALEAPRVSGGE